MSAACLLLLLSRTHAETSLKCEFVSCGRQSVGLWLFVDYAIFVIVFILLAMDLYAMVKNAKAYFTIDVNWHILSWINYGFFSVCFVLILSIDHVSKDIGGMLPLTDEADEFHWLHHMELMQEYLSLRSVNCLLTWCT